MTTEIKCLDYGFVKLLNISSAVHREANEESLFSARDIDPAKCARISFDNYGAERSEELDLKLLRYLMSNRHNTPVEMTEIWLEMKLPIFVARQFVRHRTACINEVSGRYSTLPAEWYIPEKVGGKPTGGAKQGQSGRVPEPLETAFKASLNIHCKKGYENYLKCIEEGIAPEHARLLLSLNHYTHWIWKQDLSNMLHFLSLRDHSHAQIEAQVYARAIKELIRGVLPETISYYEEMQA